MINVKRYLINYNKFVTQRIPEPLRIPEFIALVLVIVAPVVFVFNLLISFRNFTLYNLSITPQVVSLEKMLNDRYDNISRRIYIEDGVTYDPIYIFQEEELQPVYLFTEGETSKPINYLFTEGEASQFTYDFVVYVPSDVSFNETEMTTRLHGFKLASKFFKIQTF